MSLDRRHFLGAGLSLGAGAAVTGRVAGPGVDHGPGPESNLERSGPVGGDWGVKVDEDRVESPIGLSVNGRSQPMGVDPDDVALAWQMPGQRRGARQLAYRLVVTPRSAGTTAWHGPEVHSGRQAFVAYDGPALPALAAVDWGVEVLDDRGPWSPAATSWFVTGPRTSADWRGAQWLHPDATNGQPDRHTYLRTQARLPGGRVDWAVALLAAAHRAELWVNGTAAVSGPSFCYPDEQYVQAVDVTALVRPGQDNALAVMHHWYGPGQGRPASSPGLLCLVVVHYADPDRLVTMATDGSWRWHRGAWLPAPQRNSDVGDFVEVIDGRLEPSGWTQPGYDDVRWSPATVIGPVGTAPFTGLVAQRTAITEHLVPPVSVRRLADGAVVADFGQVFAGRPQVTFTHGQPGRSLAMVAGYLLDPDGHVSSLHGTQETDLAFGFIQRSGRQVFAPFTYLGLRYFEIDGLGPAEPLPDVVLVARHCAMPEAQAAGLTSDMATVDAVWALGARSALYCTQEQFIDTPTREKGQFLWDACNESQTVMRALGEANLTWQALGDFARSQVRYWPDGRVNAVYPNDDGAREFPTFTAWYPEWLWRYYLATGDLATVERWLPVAQKVAAYLTGHVNPATGLVTGLLESSDGDPLYGLDLGVAVDTSVNLLTVNALDRVARLNALVAGAVPGSSDSRIPLGLAEAVNGHLRRPDGIYVDGLEPDGSPSPHASQQVNLQALAYGVVPPAQLPAVGRYVAGLGMSVAPDHGLELLRALSAAGRTEDVLRRVTDRRSAGWARILALGGTFTWEEWDPSDLLGDSMSHGWGSSVLVGIDETLIGLQPLPQPATGSGPRWSLAPPTAGLRHAATSVPTVAGTLLAAWQRARRQWRVELGIPPNATVNMQLFGSRPEGITESGRPLARTMGVQSVTTEAGGTSLEIGAGSYVFHASRTS